MFGVAAELRYDVCVIDGVDEPPRRYATYDIRAI